MSREAVRADLVGALLPVREDGRVLVLQRPEGTWDPPGGRLASGESFEAGATRELYEETGLLVAPERAFASWVGGGPSGRLAAVTYLGRVPESEVVISHEHLGYRWVSSEEWAGMKSWWSHENRRKVFDEIPRLKGRPTPAPPEVRPDAPPVEANLGAGSVVVDFGGDEPRALLLRRRKPPEGLLENPGGMLEAGEDFAACARRETLEETGIDARPEGVWWARVEPWRGSDDKELYAGVAFVSRYAGGEISLEDAAHDSFYWATEAEWRSARTWYTPEESEALWGRIGEMGRA
ncbi:NUDIX domain-containing protein [Rubrobacter indicoceani]|uniref:NUDIX domain-containing protein n=1 Tax=Rubrobacter indicoceani TaxID=2051957 RepID=UPI000E5C2509|nr:NUDIX domain-containing protein [Rubrobacter indicoceani]